MRALRGRGRFLKKKTRKKNKDPIFFAFYIVDDLISCNKNLKNKKKLRDPYKNPEVKKPIFAVLEPLHTRKLKFLVCMSSFPKK